MANVPITGVAATIASVTSGTDLKQIVDTSTDVRAFVPSFIADAFDTTPLAAAAIRNTTGLTSGEVAFRAVYPRTTPRVGASGLVTYATAPPFNCNAFSVTFDWGEADITKYTGTAQTYKIWRPGALPRISGTFNAYAADDGTPALPTGPNVSSGAVSFKLAEDGTADPTLAGAIVVTGNNYDEIMATNPLIPVSYSFVGSGTAAWTISAGDTLPALLPAGNVDAPDWDMNADGTPDVSATFTLASGRTIAAPVFIRSLTLASSATGLIEVSGVLRIAGIVTRA
jgi:hypothetical protein